MKLAGKPLPLSLPRNIKAEVSILVNWIISLGSTDTRPSASEANAQDVNIRQALRPTSTSQQLYPVPSIAFPLPQSSIPGVYESSIGQSAIVPPDYDARDPHAHPPPLSQQYAPTIPQDDGRSSQPIRRGFASKPFGVSGSHSIDVDVY